MTARPNLKRLLEAALALSIRFHEVAISVYGLGERLFPQIIAQLQAPVSEDRYVDHTNARRVESSV